MKFSRILGVAAAVLVTTALAKQATPPAPAPETNAPAAAAPATPAPATAPATGEAAATPAEAAPAAPVDTTPATWGDAKVGQTKAGACAACHGVDGNSSDAQYPKLAGQHEAYIWRQLRLFKSGERQNPIMQGMAAPLSEQDMRDIGAYFATQTPAAGVADDTPIASGPNQGKAFYQVGERIFRGGKAETATPACQACHGPAGRGIPGPTFPSIGGQHASYTVAQLKFFRDGGTWGTGPHANVIMSTIAKDLTDEEIQALGTYIEGLHPNAPAP